MNTLDSYPDVDSRPYFEGMARGEVLLQHCAQCHRFQFPPRAFCIHCGADTLVWEPISGKGTIYAKTITYRPPHEAFAQIVPYAVALVDLEEGVRVMARAAVPPEQVHTGMEVHVFPEEKALLAPSLVFRPGGSHAG